MTPGFIQFAHRGTPVAPPPPVYPGDVVEEMGLQQNSAVFDRRGLVVQNNGDALVAWRRQFLSGGQTATSYMLARRVSGLWQPPVSAGGTSSISDIYGAGVMSDGSAFVVHRSGYRANLSRYPVGATSPTVTSVPGRFSGSLFFDGRAVGLPNGDILFVYRGKPQNASGIQDEVNSRLYRNGVWGPVRTIAQIGFPSSFSMELAVSPTGEEAVVAYRVSQSGGSAYLSVSRSGDGGDTWGGPQTISAVTPTAFDVSYDLQANATLVYAFQTPNATTDFGLAFNRLEGGQWQLPFETQTVIDESAFGTGFPSDLTMSGSSVAYRKTTSPDGGTTLVVTMYVRDYVNGSWSEPQEITPATSAAKGCLVTLANGERVLGTRELETYTQSGFTRNRTSVDFWVRRGSVWQPPVRPSQLVNDGSSNAVVFNPVLAMSPNRRVALGVSGIDAPGAWSTDRLFATVYTPN